MPFDKNNLKKKLRSFKATPLSQESAGISLIAIMVLSLSLGALSYNAWVTGYPGNNYFPPNSVQIYLSLFLSLFGFQILFGSEARATKVSKELIYLVIVYSLIALSINAIQYTPFLPIDDELVAFEARLYSFYLPDAMEWLNKFPTLKELLHFSYKSLDWQLFLIPLVLVSFDKIEKLREYYFLLLFTGLIGFTFYYFFPTTAPASMFQSPYFEESQYATGLKFWQIHQHIQPTTVAGGMISIPSFHVIFAWICLFSLREWKILYTPLFINNLFLFSSCVLLGWHYLIDIVASFMLLLFAHFIYSLLGRQSRLKPATLRSQKVSEAENTRIC